MTYRFASLFRIVCFSIKYFQYVIYGLASFFFLYGLLLLAEGFYTTSAVKQTFGEFKSTSFGRCVSLTVSTCAEFVSLESSVLLLLHDWLISLFQLIVLTYVLAAIWLAIFGFTAIPVFFLYNMESSCHKVNILSETTIFNQHSRVCIDARQYGTSSCLIILFKSFGHFKFLTKRL